MLCLHIQILCRILYLIQEPLDNFIYRMSDFEQDSKQDLFNLILENPRYEISQTSLTDSFAKKLQTSFSQRCAGCLSQLHKVLIYCKQQVYCVGCFSKCNTEGHPYTFVDLKRKKNNESRWTLFEELRIINELSVLGVQNCQEVADNLGMPDSAALIQEYQNSFLQHKPQDNKKNEEIQKTEPWRQIYQEFTNSLLMNEYQIVDYMLAQMHEKSDPELSNFLISYKQKEDYQRDKIFKQIQKLAKEYPKRSINPNQIQYQDEDLCMSDLQIEDSTDEQEFWQKSMMLLKEADELIEKRMQKNESRREIASSPTEEVQLPTNKHRMIEKQTRILRRQNRFATKLPPKRSTKKTFNNND